MAEQTEVEWPTCEQDGCIGIRIASARMCLVHAGEKETAAALRLVGETGAIDMRGVPITNAVLQRILTAAPHGENDEPLLKDCRFDGATFIGVAGFDGATFIVVARFDGAAFCSGAWFNEAIFTGGAQFDEATFTGDARFDEATFRSDAQFDEATFTGGAQFGGATFTGGAQFGGVTFSRAARFGGATFTGGARFDEATFSRGAQFGGVTFSRGAQFGGVTFTNGAQFGGATFTGLTRFDGATFTGDTRFDEATFRSGVQFNRATFTGGAQFGGATFTGDVWFDGATFTSVVWFGGATFKRRAEFAGVRFEQARQFGPLLAHRVLVLDDAQFTQPVQIEVSSTGVSCRRARFPGGVQFRLRWARVVLDDTDLAAPSILAGIPYLSNKELARREEQIARAWQRLLAGEISERPQLMSLRRANVAGLTLSNASAADCRFAGAHNLDKLRLESDVSFATAPLPVSWRGRRWGGREVIAEERAWRAGQP